MAPKRLLVVFDFDWYVSQTPLWYALVLTVSARTIADQDTDRYIFEVNNIGLRRKLEDLDGKMEWTDLM